MSTTLMSPRATLPTLKRRGFSMSNMLAQQQQRATVASISPVVKSTAQRTIVDDIILSLVSASKNVENGRQIFTSYQWDTHEKTMCSKSFKDAVFFLLRHPVEDKDAEAISLHFRTSLGDFDYVSFILAFITAYESPAPTYEPLQATPSPVLTSRQLQLWQKARHETTAVGAANRFNAIIEDKALERALLALDDALTRRLINRFPDYTAIPNLQRKDFQTSMRNMLNLKLSAIEANCLFGYFDTNGDGIVSKKELADALQALSNESKKRLTNVAFVANTPKSKSTRELPVTKRAREQSKDFSRDEFKKAVVILTDTITPESSLDLPDSVLSQAYLRKCIFEQLNVRLSALQMQCLCHKLSKVRVAPLIERNKLVRSYSSAVETGDEQDQMQEGPINGKIIENFYKQLKKYIGPMSTKL